MIVEFDTDYITDITSDTGSNKHTITLRVPEEFTTRILDIKRKEAEARQYGRTFNFHTISDAFSDWLRQLKKRKLDEKTKRSTFMAGTIYNDLGVDKIIFNDPATIVFANGERYVTKAYKEDFDKEKGLALAILKSLGISYLDLQRLIKSATVQEKKAPKKTEPAKVVKETKVAEKPKKKRAGRVEKTIEVEKDGSRYTIHKGKRRGVGQKLQQGDMVLVRLCKVYDWEEIEVVRGLIGRPLMIDYVGEHSLRVKLPEEKRTYEFSRNEVDRI